MMTLTQAILCTLSYHDLFDYPLKSTEVHKYLIYKKVSLKTVETRLKILKNAKIIIFHKNYYCLNKKKLIIKKRLEREKYSRPKFKKALFYSGILKFVPTIKLLAVTGALAMENSTKSDDIDLMIITAKNSLWTTRLLTIFALYPFKRNPNSHNKSNRACLNIFISENDFKIKEQNLYTAHEISQMNVLWDRNKTYSKFLKSNSWTKYYLPNQIPIITKSAKLNYDIKFPSFIELVSKKIQLKHMKSKITTEKIGESQLFFHPKNTQNIVLERYNKLTKKYFK